MNNTRIEQLQLTNSNLLVTVQGLKSQKNEESSELETVLKQEKLTHEQTRQDLKVLRNKYQESNEYLKKEVMKSNELKREIKGLEEEILKLKKIILGKTKEIEGKETPL